jgi:OPA family glycerol-3-phosphate transporter-like MFS transporter
MITSVAAVLMWIYVRDNPEDVGLPPVDHGDAHGVEDEKPAPLGWIIKKVFSSRTLWIISGAYFCTGVVRHGLDQWYVSYLKEVQHINPNDWGQYVTAYIFPIAATAGSFAAGIASDKLFGARRGPPTAVMYAAQLVLLFAFQFVAHPVLAIALLVMLQFFVNGPHSLLGGAAAMDFGGRKAAGTAAGLIDAFQYIGAGLTGFGVGAIVDKVGWGGWTASLMAFAALGAILMGSLWNARPVKKAGGH